MDHSHMNHGHMDHGHMDHGGHGGMDMGGNQCSMNMIFHWDTSNLCIVFDWWQIKGPLSLIFTLVAVALLTAGYEAVREVSRRYDQKSAEGANRLPPDNEEQDESAPRSWYKRLGQSQAAQEQRDKAIKAFLYAVQVFYSFFIMLLFMTYNGWIMLAVAAGAFIGYLGFGSGPSAKTVACH